VAAVAAMRIVIKLAELVEVVQAALEVERYR
jgi:hypothetical protein